MASQIKKPPVLRPRLLPITLSVKLRAAFKKIKVAKEEFADNVIHGYQLDITIDMIEAINSIINICQGNLPYFFRISSELKAMKLSLPRKIVARWQVIAQYKELYPILRGMMHAGIPRHHGLHRAT